MAKGFNAIADRITRNSDLPSVRPLTVTFHFYFNTDLNALSPIFLISDGSGGFAGLYLNSDGSTIAMYATGTGAGTGTNLTTGNWYYLALQIDTSQMRCYLNGTLDATLTYSGTFTPTIMGMMSNLSSQYADGRLCNLKIWSAILSVSEIKNERYRMTPHRHSNLYGAWPLPPNSTKGFLDISKNNRDWTSNGTITNVQNTPNVRNRPMLRSYNYISAVATGVKPWLYYQQTGVAL